MIQVLSMQLIMIILQFLKLVWNLEAKTNGKTSNASTVQTR